MFMKTKLIDPATVPGWGVDADPTNEPTRPMRQRTESLHEGYTWKRPRQQRPTVEILHSNERPGLSATFGTSTPPRGLSGVLRRHAFKFSESSYGHWLPLMVADRIGVMEGIAEDLAHGHIPNLIAEKGWKAEWRYNRPAFVNKTAAAVVVAGLVGAGLYYLFRPAPRPAVRPQLRRTRMPAA
jgi:hypothetical protein